jgi:hypothetical protein
LIKGSKSKQLAQIHTAIGIDCNCKRFFIFRQGRYLQIYLSNYGAQFVADFGKLGLQGLGLGFVGAGFGAACFGAAGFGAACLGAAGVGAACFGAAGVGAACFGAAGVGAACFGAACFGTAGVGSACFGAAGVGEGPVCDFADGGVRGSEEVAPEGPSAGRVYGRDVITPRVGANLTGPDLITSFRTDCGARW